MAQTQRPRVGIALGGGGALGLAHVGVLLWMERNHVPVDVITGTSMGALMGGAYASGMSAEDLKKLVEGIDWDAAFQGNAPFTDLRFRRKEDKRAFPNRFELGIKHGVRGPSGVTSGFVLILLLDHIFVGIPSNQTFDQLATPFRCIATDLVSADRVEISDGPLAEALRASSAIPGLFEPVRRQGQVLVDGGLVDNLPVDSARGLGADIVIASVLPAATVKADDLQGLSILSRSVSVAIVQNERRSQKKAQIVIEPDVASFSASDYDQHAALIEKGIEAARAQKEKLLQYALNDADWADWVKARAARRALKAPLFSKVQVRGGTQAADQRVSRKIETLLSASGDKVKPLEAQQIENVLFEEYGTGRYTSAGYSGTVDADGKRTLDVDLSEKLHGPPFVYVNPEVRGEDSGRTDLTVNSRLVFMDLGGQGGELRADLSIGSHALAGAEYYRKFGQSGWFWAPHAMADRRQSSFYESGKRTADFDIRQAIVGLDFGYTTTLDNEFRFGVDYGRISTALQTGAVPFGNQDGVLKAFKMQFTHDGQNSAQVPSRGLRFTAAGKYFFDSPVSSRFPLLSFEGSWFRPVINDANRVFVLTRGGTSFGNVLAVPLQFTLGGPLRLSAYGLDEFRGDRIGYASAGLLHRVGSLPAVLGGNLFLGAWYEAGGFSLQGQQSWRQDGTLGFVAETPLGPFYLGWSLGRSAEQWRGKFSFLVGRFF